MPLGVVSHDGSELVGGDVQVQVDLSGRDDGRFVGILQPEGRIGG